MATASHFTRTYTTYSGVDITAIFDNIALATLTGIAISVTREKAPVYTMGSANPRSISRNKRGTAGSLMFTLFDRDAFYGLFLSEAHKYYAHADEVNWLTNPINVAESIGTFYQQADFANTFTGQNLLNTGTLQNAGRSIDSKTGVPGGTLNIVNGLSTGEIAGGGALGGNPAGLTAGQDNAANNQKYFVGARTVRKSAMYADQVMPFDITLVAQNEYGHASAAGVIGVEIINEGGGISMDDITNEQQMTYIAIYRLPWYSLNQGVQRESIYGSTMRLTDTTVKGNLFSVALSGNAAAIGGQGLTGGGFQNTAGANFTPNAGAKP